MRIVTGTVIDGKVELAGVPDGTTVAILAPDDHGFRLTAEQEAELTVSLAAINDGDFEDGEELLAEIRGTQRG